MKNFLNRNKQKIILFLFFIGLTSIPFIFWGRLNFVGGDDTRLYYFFPYEFLKNFANNIISDNNISGLGYYFPNNYISSFVIFILVIKKVLFFINTQFLMFGLNISMGFLFFYFLLGNWIKNDEGNGFWIKVISSLFYCLSTFIYFTLYSALWPAMYLISIFPLTAYFLIRSYREDKLKYAVIAAIIFSLLGNFIGNIPWLFAILISLIPIFILAFFKDARRFLKHGFFFTLVFILLSFFSLIHFIYAPLVSSENDLNPVSRTSKNSTDDIKFNEDLIVSLTEDNNIIYPLFDLFHKSIQENFHWKTYDNYKNWSLRIMPINIIFLLVIFLALFNINKTSKEIRQLYIGAIISWLFALYFFTVNVGPYGIDLFLWLNKNVPGFSMFRNMYDKFGLAMAFTYALVLGVSLKILLDSINKNVIKKFILAILIILILLNAKSFILGESLKLSFRGVGNYFDTINDFNDDFKNLLAYVKNIDDSSRILWLPLSTDNYVIIQDSKLTNHYYVGPSPLKVLSDKNDFAGNYSFFKEGERLINDLILQKKYNDVGNFFRKMNVKYIIVNNDIPESWRISYMYSVQQPSNVYDAQQKEFQGVVLGKKIKSFGTKYTLYEINSKFDNEKIYLTKDPGIFPSNFADVVYKKISSAKYQITLSFKGKENLVFLDPYHKLWKLYLEPINQTSATSTPDIFKKNIFDDQHSMALNYANYWVIDSDYIKNNYSHSYYTENSDGSINVKLLLIFIPQMYFYGGLAVSLITLIICIIYLFYYKKNIRLIDLAVNHHKKT